MKHETEKKDDSEIIYEPLGDKSDDEKPKISSDTRIAIVLIVAVAILIAFVMIAHNRLVSVQEIPKRSYNNFEFVQQGNLWRTEVQVNNSLIVIPMHYPPWETEYIRIQGSLWNSFNTGNLYVSFDPTVENVSVVALAAAELSLNLAQGINRNLIAACSVNETEPCHTRPIIDCNNTQESVILLQEGGEPHVDLDGNCITITGKDAELVKAVDRLLMYWYGVLPKILVTE